MQNTLKKKKLFILPPQIPLSQSNSQVPMSTRSLLCLGRVRAENKNLILHSAPPVSLAAGTVLANKAA